jgi:serine/threonine-protein kinase
VIGAVLHETYRITRLIGEGGMGSVYEAVHVRLAKKRFAVKMLRRDATADPAAYARFRREAEVMTEIGHPHIVQVLDFNVTEDGKPYIVMELLEGEDLANRIQRLGRLEPQEVALVVDQVASALQTAHDHDVVHRDIKPANIYLLKLQGGALHAKVLDFGLSKIRHTKSIVTQSQSVFGTPYYMSPEQAIGTVDEIDHRTDVFALGCIAYQALTGELPFDAPTIPGTLYKVCHIEPSPIRMIMPEIPAGVEQVLGRAMAKDKSARYERVDCFAQDLHEALVGACSGGIDDTEETVSPEDEDQPTQPVGMVLGRSLLSSGASRGTKLGRKDPSPRK